MKIISIKFKNINSFRGEHYVSFDTPEIRQQGIFTITGPTGAGKTTILDAITVALYNKVSRHGKDTEHILSRHTADCSSEVVFEINGEQYRSVWSCYMSNPRKEDKQPEAKWNMDLYHITGSEPNRAIATKHTAVPAKIEDIVKLSYDQFTRSVLLAQGQFDAFLHAKPDVKSSLLEQITGINIYTKIGKLAHQKFTEQKLALDNLEREKSYLTILSDDALAQLLAAIAHIQQQKQQLETAINTHTQQLQLLNEATKWQQKCSSDKAAFDSAQADLEVLQPQIARLEKHKNALPFQKNLDDWKEKIRHISDLSNKIDLTNTQLVALIADEKQMKTDLQTLQTDLDACLIEQQTKEPIIEQTLRYETQLADKQPQLQTLQKTEQTLSVQINELKKQIDEQKKQIDETQIQQQILSQWLQQNATDHNINVQLIATKLNALNEVRQRYSEQMEVAKKQNEQAQSSVQKQAQSKDNEAKITEKINFAQKQSIALSQQIHTLPTPELLTQIVAQLQETIPLLKLQMERKRYFDEKNQQREQLLKQLNEQKAQLKTAEQEKSATETDLTAAATLLETTEKLYEAEKTIANFDQHRHKLHPNEPCPLCGSTNHPLLAGNYVPKLSQTEQNRNEQRKQHEFLSKKLLLADKNIATISTQIGNIIDNGKLITADLDEFKTTFEQQNVRLGLLLSIDNIKDELNVLCTEKQQELDREKGKQSTYQQLNNEIEKLKTEQNRLQTEVLNCKNQQNILAEQQKSAEQNAQNAQKQAKQLTDEGKEKRSELNEILQAHQLSIPELGNTTQFISTIQERYNTYQNKHEEGQNTEKKARELQTEIEKTRLLLANEQQNCLATTANLQKQQIDIAKLEQLIAQNIASFELKDAAKERQRISHLIANYNQAKQDLTPLLTQISTQLVAKEQLMADAKAERETLFNLSQFEEQHLKEKIPAAGFASIADLDNAFLDHQIAQKLADEIAEKRETVAQKQTLLHSSEQQLANFQQQSNTTHSADNLAILIVEQKQQQQTHSESIGGLQQQKSNHEAQVEKATALTEKINAQRLITGRWETIKKIVGSADGKDFRATAQAITLDHLVLLANRHIRQLSDRYTIQKNSSGIKDKELELEIVDEHQADAVRPMKSLSGGESFLVSLALALGLSDLASKNRPIGSLFIDEGFGSLSPDALDMALNTFENLQEQGKIIGIISHVEALKERIPAQIQVSKKGNSGTSEIKSIFARK